MTTDTPQAAISTSVGDVALSLSCPDRPGIVHAVSQFFYNRGGDIVDSQQFGDRITRRFFLRVRVMVPAADAASLRDEFNSTAEKFSMQWELVDTASRPRFMLMVSKFGHCLNDLLYRWSTDQLKIHIPVVVSNHTDFRELAERFGVEFVHLPVTGDSKADAERRLLELVAEYDIDTIVLARYMQILSDSLCAQLEGRIINIHHSFLPSFKGGRPYHRAAERGVKLVGATAHFVTADLDEGPIIEQDVVRVDHSHSVDDLIVAGRDAECRALARAVQWHSENRVFINAGRTVILR